MTTKGDDRRRYARIARQDRIQIKEFTLPERGRYQPATIRDLSGGGLQIETSQFFAEGALLKVEMNFTGWQRYTSGFLKHFGEAATRPLVVLARVIRCQTEVPGERYEVALQFDGIDESQRAALVRFIRHVLETQR